MHLVQGDPNLLSVRNIDFDADGVATLAGDLRGLIGGRIAVEVEDGDLGAVVRQASPVTTATLSIGGSAMASPKGHHEQIRKYTRTHTYKYTHMYICVKLTKGRP